jgi:hypothetical protein
MQGTASPSEDRKKDRDVNLSRHAQATIGFVGGTTRRWPLALGLALGCGLFVGEAALGPASVAWAKKKGKADGAPSGKTDAAPSGKADGAKADKPGETVAAAETKTEAKPAPVEEPKGAAKPASFADARDSAVDGNDLSNVLEPLFAECKQASDLERRRCETIRAWHAERLRSTRFYALGDASSLVAQPYDSTEKTLTLVVTGCVACDRRPEVAGAPRLVVSKAPHGFDGSAPIGIDLDIFEIKLDDAAKAAQFLDRQMKRLRVEYVFAVEKPFETTGKDPMKGILVNPIARRLYNSCTGEVLGQNLPGPTKLGAKEFTRDASCPALGAPTEEELDERRQQAALPDALTRKDIEAAMSPAQKRIFECGEEFELKGTAKVSIVLSPDARNPKITILPPYDTGDAHLCLKVALREAKFPAYKRATGQQKFDYTFVLRK